MPGSRYRPNSQKITIGQTLSKCVVSIINFHFLNSWYTHCIVAIAKWFLSLTFTIHKLVINCAYCATDQSRKVVILWNHSAPLVKHCLVKKPVKNRTHDSSKMSVCPPLCSPLLPRRPSSSCSRAAAGANTIQPQRVIISSPFYGADNVLVTYSKSPLLLSSPPLSHLPPVHSLLTSLVMSSTASPN